MTRPAGRIFRFDVRLQEIEPAIWRHLEIPSNSTFWDLHVAIQDAMGWLDYHLHEFRPERTQSAGRVRIGIPDGDFDADVVAGWSVPVAKHFTTPGDTATYEYDFGDAWTHDVTLIAVEPRKRGVKYPRCAGGERACPPEDCGGEPGYCNLLEILADPRHEEHDDTIAWLKGHAKNYHPYDPEAFDPQRVKFSSARRRLKRMLEGAD
jgi:hypothetical protein